MKYSISLVIAAFALSSPAGAQNNDIENVKALMKELGGESMSDKEAQAYAEKQNSSTLGQPQNPVRAEMPQGQRAYLNRLRCSDGTPPKYFREGSMGIGPFGNIVDRYAVDCGDAEPGQVKLDMDMYHSGYVEKNPVPGFSIVAP
ncbi:hypothetical protein SAMN02745824_3106 [Parasphingorhabdus marina DSM 22363]|uniref:Uncharacterized protein n=1 Tax=Parasphingorhabdus marina DSM 22363 TaxID=1123272 RepID=A0A1N6H2X2_9SPHN|nr:hypothetical protein [Parasphingorhabdus marina]SIO14052.1 hypothetical protein SAMN02745824_3106 [Parasphingorhabdus marina DSM 22363]